MLLPTYLNVSFLTDDLKIYLKIRHSNIVDMSADLSSFKEILIYYNLCCFDAEKCCVMCFARRKSSIERLDITQFGSYHIRGVGLPFVVSCKVLGTLIDTESKTTFAVA